jgi:hypothetical protein
MTHLRTESLKPCALQLQLLCQSPCQDMIPFQETKPSPLHTGGQSSSRQEDQEPPPRTVVALRSRHCAPHALRQRIRARFVRCHPDGGHSSALVRRRRREPGLRRRPAGVRRGSTPTTTMPSARSRWRWCRRPCSSASTK